MSRVECFLCEKEIGRPNYGKHVLSGIHESDLKVAIVANADAIRKASYPLVKITGLSETRFVCFGCKNHWLTCPDHFRTCMHREEHVCYIKSIIGVEVCCEDNEDTRTDAERFLEAFDVMLATGIISETVHDAVLKYVSLEKGKLRIPVQ